MVDTLHEIADEWLDICQQLKSEHISVNNQHQETKVKTIDSKNDSNLVRNAKSN